MTTVTLGNKMRVACHDENFSVELDDYCHGVDTRSGIVTVTVVDGCYHTVVFDLSNNFAITKCEVVIGTQTWDLIETNVRYEFLYNTSHSEWLVFQTAMTLV